MFAPFFGGFGRCEEIWEAGQDTAWRKVVGQSQIDFQRSSKVYHSRIWFSDSAWSNPTEKEQNVTESIHQIHTLVLQTQVLLKTVDAFRCSILRVEVHSAKVPSTSSTHLFGVARRGSLTWPVWAKHLVILNVIHVVSLWIPLLVLFPLPFQLHSLCSLQSFFNNYFNLDILRHLDIISSFMSLHFFLILSQKTSFKTAPQAWQVKNVKSACAADMTFQYVSHITCLSSCLFVSSIFPYLSCLLSCFRSARLLCAFQSLCKSKHAMLHSFWSNHNDRTRPHCEITA